jgi:hypothetical protein
MLAPDDSREALSKLFLRQRVADLETLCRILKTTSRMSVFRRLSLLGYLTSYSHNGRYYTLNHVPEFDADGLWRSQGVCFSRHGSLKATVEHLVQMAEAGRTHPELSVRLQVRVHNTLLDLVQQERIRRVPLGTIYLYLSTDPHMATAQIAQRELEASAAAAEPTEQAAPLRPALVIEVLVEVIEGARAIPDPRTVRDRLMARSVSIALEQVEAIYQTYELKKTARSHSPRSQR